MAPMTRSFPFAALALLAACRTGGWVVPTPPSPDDSTHPSPVDTAGPEVLGSPCDERTYPRVRINEVLSANVRGAADEDGDSSDWIEIINLDTTEVDLTGWGLSDDPGDPLRWTLPATTLSPGEVLLVYASGKNRRGDPLHTSFGLDATGDPVGLAASDGCTVDQVDPGRLYRDISFGRPAPRPQDLEYFMEPTPGEPNSTESRPGFAATPSLEPGSGWHSGVLTVTASHSESSAVLRISHDGSVPAEDSDLYTTPFTVAATARPHVVRARAWVDGLWPSRVATATYSQDPAILADDLKIVSLVIDPFDLYDVDTGIYAYGPPDYTTSYPFFGANFWEDWERDLHISVWEPDGRLVIDQDAGVKIHGGYTRAFEQKSFRVLARTAYGPDELAYTFFPNQDWDSFPVMVLEGVGDWCPSHTENSFVDMLMRDGDGVRFPTIDSQAWEPCVVYLNGQFWGLYAFREKLDEHYIAHYHGADPDNLDRIECTADGSVDWWRVNQGDWQAFDELSTFVQGRDFSDPDAYAQLEARIDLPNLATTVLAVGYWGNTDWWYNNLKLWREREDDARWRWMTFDLGHGWPSVNYDHIGVSVSWSGEGLPIADAMENEAFRVMMANQAAELLSTSFEVGTALAKLDDMHARIEPVIPEQYAAWCGQPPSYWDSNVAFARSFVQRRPAIFQRQIQRHLGLDGTAPLTLEAQPAGAGSFQLTLIEVDPPFTGELWTGIPVTVTAVPAAGYSFAGWSDSDLGDQATTVLELDGARTITATFE